MAGDNVVDDVLDAATIFAIFSSDIDAEDDAKERQRR